MLLKRMVVRRWYVVVGGRTGVRSRNEEYLLPAGCLLLTAYCLLLTAPFAENVIS
jgi:hypothetical protein